MSYLLTEKLTSTVVMYLVLKRIIKPWKDWDAYKNGIIDIKGKRIRRPRNSKEREGWDILDRFCWSIKRLCTKYLGDSNFAYLFSAAYLMKEKCEIAFNGNRERYLTELNDLTYEKQLTLYKCLEEMKSENILRESILDYETNILKIKKKVEIVINKYMIEELTSLGDIAQATPAMTFFSPVAKKYKIKRTLVLKRRKKK